MIDLAGFGVHWGDDVTVQFAGSDSLAQPVRFEMADNADVPVRRSWKRTEGTHIRVASLNTLNEGLADPERAPAIGRMLRAVEADVYCFQEEKNSTNLERTLSTLLPGDGKLNFHRSDDCVIATRESLKPIMVKSTYFAVGGAGDPRHHRRKSGDHHRGSGLLPVQQPDRRHDP
jgi:hypothetical protein